ncbi:MAG: hypothetical protein H6Q67_527 [Firmicutes bacterium]|nr:hypothetical protein [Bacillota bacterium]
MRAASMQNPHQTATKPSFNFTIRPMNKTDANEIVNLIRDSYGDSYFYKNYYDPMKIINENATGYLKSVVAVTDDNQIIGHMALMRTPDDPQIVEPVIAVVKTGYRNAGVLASLAEFLYINRNPELFKGVSGIYIPPVTKHTYSQKQVYNHGLKDCGIWLGYLPDAEFKKISVDSIQRLTLVLTYMYVIKPKQITIYPPDRHKNMILELFKNIGVYHVECPLPKSSSEIHMDGESSLKIKTDEALGKAVLKVHRYGQHIVSDINTKLNQLCSQNFSVIHLYLSLNDPLTHYLTPLFEKMGFFFAGIMPGTSCKDTLILQYLNNTEIDYNKIQLASNTAQEILSYIIANRICKV